MVGSFVEGFGRCSIHGRIFFGGLAGFCRESGGGQTMLAGHFRYCNVGKKKKIKKIFLSPHKNPPPKARQLPPPCGAFRQSAFMHDHLEKLKRLFCLEKVTDTLYVPFHGHLADVRDRLCVFQLHMG